MATNTKLRHYIVLTPSDIARKSYGDGINAILRYVYQQIYGRETPPEGGSLVVADLPSGTVRLDRGGQSLSDQSLIVSFEFDEGSGLEAIWEAIARDKSKGVFIGAGADVRLDATEFWSPKEASYGIFGRRSEAESLLGVEYVRDGKKLRGANVNVLVVDRGVDFSAIPAKNRGTGWHVGATQPGVTAGGHGMMIVRNILNVAPDATIHDLPLLPERIGNIGTFLSLADTALTEALSDIRRFKQQGKKWSGPWIFVNAWAIFDRQTEHPPGNYTNRLQHPFNQQIASAVADNIDVVFCAGNCGQFCPDGRCGAGDWGPGRSILGANSHPDVLTIGAVRTDARWLGYSSQGPGQPNLARPGQPKAAEEKPDLCAPSQFREDYDAHLTNTGTSAASGLAAGVIAGLRSKWSADALPPDKLKSLLISTARKIEGPSWNERLGNGILNAEAACRALYALP